MAIRDKHGRVGQGKPGFPHFADVIDVDLGFFQILAFQVLAGYIIFICGGYILFCLLSTM